MSENESSSNKSSTELAEDRTEWAENRTDWAEDRTLLANERTFAGWVRTSFAAIGIGIGFNALFGELDPTWAPKAIATLFIIVGIVFMILAEHRACRAFARLQAHTATELSLPRIRLMSIAIVTGAICLIAALWLLHVPVEIKA